ncbi:MAG TPA: hypothetical protein VKR06_03725 [Ktedonosporobacter sp.]|nr:hypothetical protein [Ktedonosporobacter sp.]
MRTVQSTFSRALRGSRRPWLLLPIVLLLISLQVGTDYGVATAFAASSQRGAQAGQARPDNANVARLRQMVREGKLAPTVHVLDSLPPTTILQFPLVPSGLKSKFPDATALVTVVRGDRNDSTSDTVTIDVQKMPPNITFTIFFIEIANKPFGNVEYVADLTTRGDGTGETIFHIITLVAFAMDARNPGTSHDQEGQASGIQLEHLGMWFAQLQDAQKVLNDDTLLGTIFDGGNPPLHAGPQAMTDGQSSPVF